MKRATIISDQSNNGSDYYERSPDRLSAPKAKDLTEATTATGCHPSGHACRTVQALWEAGLQMCQGSWTRPQVLSFCKQTGNSARDGLCASGLPRPGDPLFRQQPQSTKDPRRDLRDQSRTDTPQTKTLREQNDRSRNTGAHLYDRHHPSGTFFREHAPELACGLLLQHCYSGGTR